MRRNVDELQIEGFELALISPRHIVYTVSDRAHDPMVNAKKLQTKEDLFLVAEKLADLLDGSDASFAPFLNDVTRLFLAESSSDALLQKRLLYVLYDCFQAAYECHLWVKAGLLLCAIGVVEDIYHLAERSDDSVP